LRLLWCVNALQTNFVLGVVGVKNSDGVAVGYVHDFALKDACIQVACYK
jgi:hypothetical protein